MLGGGFMIPETRAFALSGRFAGGVRETWPLFRSLRSLAPFAVRPSIRGFSKSQIFSWCVRQGDQSRGGRARRGAV